MKVNPKHDFLQAKTNFYNPLVYSLGTIAIIHLLPKSQAAFSSMRLLCTIAYFGAVLFFLYTLTKPRADFLYQLYELRFKNSPNSMKVSYKVYLESLNRMVLTFAIISMIFIAATGLFILTQWMSSLIPFQTLIKRLFWLSGIVFFASPYLFFERILETIHLRRALKRTLITSGHKPVDINKIESEFNEVNIQKSMKIIGKYNFIAGQMKWSWNDFFKNCVIFGQTGSGKTICVLNTLLDSLLGSASGIPEKCSGLILDPKGDFKNKIHLLCRKYGRDRDLLIIDPLNLNVSIRWNPFDSDDDELELADRFAAVLDGMGMKNSDSSFWIDSAKKFIRHSISLLRLTKNNQAPPDFIDIYYLASSLEKLSERVDQLDVFNDECDQCLRYFVNEWATLSDNVRSSIQTNLTNMIDPFLMKPYQYLFSGHSSITMSDAIDKGKIIYVNMPIADKESMAKMVGTFIKLEYFRQVLKRPDKKRNSFFFCDEFQSFLTTTKGKGDSDFFERSRQSRHANIVSTQNIHGFLKQTDQQLSPVNNLLSNCAVKIFLRNSDADTNEYAAKLFGEEKIANIGVNDEGGFKEMYEYDYIVRPEEFQGLKTPSYESGIDNCETIVHLSSRPDIPSKTKLQWKVHPIK